MRPEDVIVEAAAQRFCDEQGIGLDEVRHARAVGEYQWEGSHSESGWYVVEGPRSSGEGTLRMTCGPEAHIVADVRLI